MGFLVSLIITAVGFILALAVHPTHPGCVNVNTVGWILVVVGLVGFIADLLLWSSWGPGYLRRTTYVDQGPARRISRAPRLRPPRDRGRGRASRLGAGLLIVRLEPSARRATRSITPKRRPPQLHVLQDRSIRSSRVIRPRGFHPIRVTPVCHDSDMGRVVWSVREGGMGELDAPEILGGYRSANPVHRTKDRRCAPAA